MQRRWAKLEIYVFLNVKFKLIMHVLCKPYLNFKDLDILIKA